MTERRVPVFFYGLFMDAELLRTKGADPANPRIARVPGYSLRIGARAALVPDANGTAYGIVMDLTHADLDRLYADPSVNMYRPEAVLAETNGESLPALCFNLTEAPRVEEFNRGYAEKLRDLAERLELPSGYIATISRT